jgi:uncharacterized protein (UPF0276 family)
MPPAVPPARHGILLRREHCPELLAGPPAVGWVEIMGEAFLDVRGGVRWEMLERVRADLPVSVHCTGMSLGSVEPLSSEYLDRLRALVDRIEAACVSDHLAWSSFGGRQLDLLPVPYTDEALRHVCARVSRVQETLGRPLLVENPASYLSYADSELSEPEFLTALVDRAGCGILLDVNNLVVSAHNDGFDWRGYLASLPGGRVEEIHLAGHLDAGDLLVDTHQGPVPESVWTVFREAIARFPAASTIVEWDTDVPPLPVLVAESKKAAAIAAEGRA